MDEVSIERTLAVLPSQLRRALRAIDPETPYAPRDLTHAQRLFDEYRANERIYSDSVDEALDAKGIEQVNMDDPAARDAFHKRIEYDLPAMEKRRQRDAAMDVYQRELQRKRTAIEDRNSARRQ